ncbi:hypothetical protein CRYUN_Cryun15aG0010000 [Craigia yunnanensis]
MTKSGRSDDSFEISVELQPLITSLNAELKSARTSMPPSYCIFETPSMLVRHRENSFHPNRFSIGPMHHGKKKLVATEKIKIKYLNGLLSRVIKSQRTETMPEEDKEIEQQQLKTLAEWVKAV